MPFCGRKFNGSSYIGSRWSSFLDLSHGRNNRLHNQYTHNTHTPPLLTVQGSYCLLNFFLTHLISLFCRLFSWSPRVQTLEQEVDKFDVNVQASERVRTWESVAICLCVWVCDMWVGAGCSWVVQLWAEWLSEMTVINSFILEPVDYTINHVYWWHAWRTYLWVSAVHLQQVDTSYIGTVNRGANVCQVVMYLAT